MPYKIPVLEDNSKETKGKIDESGKEAVQKRVNLYIENKGLRLYSQNVE